MPPTYGGRGHNNHVHTADIVECTLRTLICVRSSYLRAYTVMTCVVWWDLPLNQSSSLFADIIIIVIVNKMHQMARYSIATRLCTIRQYELYLNFRLYSGQLPSDFATRYFYFYTNFYGATVSARTCLVCPAHWYIYWCVLFDCIWANKMMLMIAGINCFSNSNFREKCIICITHLNSGFCKDNCFAWYRLTVFCEKTNLGLKTKKIPKSISIYGCSHNSVGLCLPVCVCVCVMCLCNVTTSAEVTSGSCHAGDTVINVIVIVTWRWRRSGADEQYENSSCEVQRQIVDNDHVHSLMQRQQQQHQQWYWITDCCTSVTRTYVPLSLLSKWVLKNLGFYF